MKICPRCSRTNDEIERFCKYCGTETFFPERFQGLDKEKKEMGGQKMLGKIGMAVKYIITSLLANAIFGLILYFGFTWLNGFSLLLAYLWNIVLIILILWMDEQTLKSMESDKFIKKIQKEKDPGKVVYHINKIMKYCGSFKTDLYMFYIFILVISQLITFDPSLLGENLRYFIEANSYSILLLLAFDMFIGQFKNDRIMMDRIAAKLKKAMEKDNDED